MKQFLESLRSDADLVRRAAQKAADSCSVSPNRRKEEVSPDAQLSLNNAKSPGCRPIIIRIGLNSAFFCTTRCLCCLLINLVTTSSTRSRLRSESESVLHAAQRVAIVDSPSSVPPRSLHRKMQPSWNKDPRVLSEGRWEGLWFLMVAIVAACGS